ncbi:unnamed protein product, partial [Symbiodinium microadriaticum]
PFNTSYRLLRVHLRLAQLDNLMTSLHISSGQNCWHEIYDVGTCVDTPSLSPPASTPSSPRVAVSPGSHTFLSAGGLQMGEADKSALSSGLLTLPKPPESVSSLQNPEKYSFLSVPFQPEYQPLEMSPVLTPERYVESYMRKKQAQGDLQRKIVAAMSKSSTPTEASGDAFGKAMSHQFLEWLAKSGKAQQLMDLVRIDAEESQSSSRDNNSQLVDRSDRGPTGGNW